ncbi:DNA recombination protein RmuC [Myxococcota bacterium]|nr:DNA recombination protein RmuC [Myxococcota bacterium]MBU1509354.1 DNA recombination protein RmuC [Myxococcota bacterium]
MDFLALFLGIFIGVLIGFLIARLRSRARTGSTEEETRLRAELERVGLALAGAQERIRSLEARCAEWKEEQAGWSGRLERLQREKSGLEAEVARLEQELEGTRAAAGEKLAELTSARDQLVMTFRATAAQLLQETREQGVDQQREKLEIALRPFQDQLKGFQELVRTTYSEEVRDRVALKKEIELLALRHQSLSQEAQRLTLALTGSSKVRGDWGEITLLRLLEKSGLREGHEFRIQESSTQADGSRLRPDVVVSLPHDGALIIDSKLQLVSWMKVCEATTPEEARNAGVELAAAVRTHFRSLNRKSYQELYSDSIDLVVMYLPIDAALLAALDASPELFEEAHALGVILTGPTLLMALLGSLAQQWRTRQQERNVVKIAKLAEALGKKLEGFLVSYEELGQRLRQGVAVYNRGWGQLAAGNGNVIRRAAELGELGIKSARKLGVDWETADLAVESVPLAEEPVED